MTYLEQYNLKNKTAYVCGGVGLIGAEVTRALAEARAKVVILDVDQEKGTALARELRGQGLNVSFEPFDVTNIKSLEKSFNRLMNAYKGIDIWVNMAYPRTKDWAAPIEDVTIENIQTNVDWQLNSCLLISKMVALEMKKKKTPGSIINSGSIYGVQANDFTVYEGTGMSSPYAYSAIKAGVINLTRYLASYFGADRIRANCICPGGVFNKQNKRFVKNYEHKVPLKRLGTPQEIASSVLFLASDASAYITGTALMVDGGWSAV